MILTDRERHDIARRAARRYAHFRWVDQQDIIQEALLAIVTAERTFAELGDDGRNVRGYVMRAAQHAVRWFVWSATSPVKHTDRATIGKEASELRRVVSTDGAPLDIPDDDELPHDKRLALARWRAAVRARFDALTAKDAACDRDIARRVLFDDEAPEDVAQDEQVPVRAVYVVTQRIRTRIYNDEQMLLLLLDVLERGHETTHATTED